MGLFTRSKKLSSLKAEIEVLKLQQKSQPIRFWDKKGNLIPLFDFSSYVDVDKAIRTVPELSSIINYIGKSFSSGIYKEFQNDKEIENSNVVKLLRNPHQLYSGSEFKQAIGEILFSFGVCHLYMNTPGRRENTESIMILPPQDTNIYVGKITVDEFLKNSEELIKHYEFNFNGKTHKIPKDEIITITLNTKPIIENEYLHYESPLKPLQDALMVTPAMYDSMSNLMDNYGMKGFISNQTTDSGGYMPIEEEEKEQIQKDFNKYGTKKGQRQISFVRYDLKYVPVSSPIKDMLLPEQQTMIKTIVADVIGFDTILLNNSDASKYGVFYKEARKSLFTENLIPASNNYSETISKYLYKFKPNNNIILDYSHLDIFSQDEKENAEKITLESNYIISLNEAVRNGMNINSAIELLILNGYDEKTAKILIS